MAGMNDPRPFNPCPIDWRALERDLRDIRPNEIIIRRGYAVMWPLRSEERTFSFKYLHT